ncbi:MAG: protoglobin domain-containing protein, partial [Planctomycetota bacterium]
MSVPNSRESHVLADRADVDISVFFERIKSYVGWQERDAERVRRVWPQVEPLVSSLVEDFYSTILA